MTEHEVLTKIREAKKALEEYNSNLAANKGWWYTDIQKELPDLIQKSHVLNASGSVCTCCNGSGRR
ncbi:hypothetical protein CPT03_19085 [Pedobacter ginsengisoli]|uniref:Uncharacterized protein n=1 Tax=Pedobacter ginsengisoli TaxID=363852 RepID=A0A2D1U9Z7_9SPHI|nr:hypothetical protein [Pedobacter ginsengisoli]ATP58416.1 hypothetical protein CPT03_19085 [Pedobacter ginsengisoli]